MNDIAVITEKERLEAIVIRGETTFLDVAEALIQLRSNDYWRQDAPTWQGYCELRFGWKDGSRARQIIAAFQTQQRTKVKLPNERVARRLEGVPEPLQDIVAEKAESKATAEKRIMTTTDIDDASKEVEGANPQWEAVMQSPYTHLKQMIEANTITAGNALRVVLALDACEASRRPFMIKAKLLQPAVIAELNRMSWESFQEIATTGYLQRDEPEQAVKITDATYKDVRDWLDWKFRNHRATNGTHKHLVVSLNTTDAEQVIRELSALPLELRGEVAAAMLIDYGREKLKLDIAGEQIVMAA